MALARVSCAWQGWPGSPGVSQMYIAGTPVQGNIDAIRTFFNSLAAGLPSGLTIQVPSSGDVLSETDGSIQTTWSVGSTPAVVTGTNLGAYAGNAGAVVHWLTAGVVSNRRVRGRTFLVPLCNDRYDTSGSISTAFLSTLSTAASTYVTAQAGAAVVWARPAPGRSGSMHAITSSRVPDLAVSLRSRRT